jgi:flagellar biosynthesis/type III secretory pathway chaperone
MNQAWETVAENLRAEIAEYGRLLVLFEEQRNLIRRADPEGVLRVSNEIQAQVAVLDQCRHTRECEIEAFAKALGRPGSSTLRSLLPLIVPDARPLLEALIAEVNLLIHRVRRDGRQNHRLLACAVECHQEVLRRLRPEAFTKTYAPDGRVSVAALRPMPLTSTAG